MIRRDTTYETKKVILLFDQETGAIWLRLLRPLKGVPTYATPKLAVDYQSLMQFERDARGIAKFELSATLEVGPVRVYTDRPRHVIVKLDRRRFCEGPLDVLEFAVRRIIDRRGTWEQQQARAGRRLPKSEESPEP